MTGQPVVIFVLGMGRSGTAALTRVLNLCGATLPPDMVGAGPSNPLGFWEPRQAVILNRTILHRHSSTWYDPSLRLQTGGFDTKVRADCVGEIAGFLATLPATPLVVIKDPWTTALADLWFEAAHQTGCDIAAVIALRHPQEVVASLVAHSYASRPLAAALWLKYSLLAERQTRGVPRLVVEYARLLDDWQGEVKRISAALGVDLRVGDGKAVDGFLQPGLRRQRCETPMAEPFGADWVRAVYETLGAAARDEHCDTGRLDRVFAAYRAAEDFRAVFDDYRRIRRVDWLSRPAVLRLSLGVAARMHRRRGTWA